MLESASDLRLVGVAASGAEALRAVGTLKPDLVLMDVHMPEMDGPATARALLARHPHLAIIAWTVSESSVDLLRMIKAGCSGYILKDAGPMELERALLAALRSESPVPRRMIPDVLKRVAESTLTAQDAKVALTPRETDMLRGVAKGYTTKRLAKEFGLAPTSVDTHLRNMFKKLGVANRGEAVSAGLKLGLISLADI